MPIRKSRVSGIAASGTTADRPSNPSIGDTFFNGTLGVQEIYTSSGWLASTGANDFNIALTGSETVVTLDKEYVSGAYTVISSLSDTTLDIYLFNSSNFTVGYSKGAAITANYNFNKVIVYGGTAGDLLSFSFKTTFTGSASTTETYAPPYALTVDNADLPNIDDTTTITGGNFDTDIEVWFDGANSYSQQAKSVVYGSSTSIVATRPDDLVEDNAPYTLRLINPNTTSPTGSNRHKLVDSITAGGDPTWTTAAGALPEADSGLAYSTTVVATDPDGAAISYALASGSFPEGLSINPSTGEISGSASNTTNQNYSFVIAASDPSGNVTNRSFSIQANAFIVAAGGTINDVTIGGQDYRVHTFDSVGTSYFNVSEAPAGATVEFLIIAGGGGGGVGSNGNDCGGGGGGAGGYLSSVAGENSGQNSATLPPASISVNNYEIIVGNGGSGGQGGGRAGANGQNSSAFGLTAIGGGGGANRDSTAGSGGSGGGGSCTGNNGTGTTGQGFGVSGSGGTPSGATYGGGGAGGPGSVEGSTSGPGGVGITSNITGTPTGRAGGGGGGRGSGGGPGGASDGGGAGGNISGLSGQSGAANTGGGGGGAGGYANSGTNGGYGGTGVVIIRYPI